MSLELEKKKQTAQESLFVVGFLLCNLLKLLLHMFDIYALLQLMEYNCVCLLFNVNMAVFLH